MKIKIIRGKKKLNEAQETMPPFGNTKAPTTMPPFGNTPQKALKTGVWAMEKPKKPERTLDNPIKEPKPKRNLNDRETHYNEFKDRVVSIVDRWFVEHVVQSGTYDIMDILEAIQNDDTLLNRLDQSVQDGFIKSRTRDVIMKFYEVDNTFIQRLMDELSKKWEKASSIKQNWANPSLPSTGQGAMSPSAIDSQANTLDEGIIVDVLPHLMEYLYLFAHESWYGLTGQAPMAAMDALWPKRMYGDDSREAKEMQLFEHMRKLIETAFAKWITKGWTPLKSSISKADWMKDYDMDTKWPERSYKLRENKRKIKVKIV